MYCKVNTGKKIIYNIAKKKVVAATKIADDDYIVALDRSTNKIFNAYQDADFFCFICY